MPFIIGFGIAFMLRPIVKKLAKLTNGHEKAWSIITILLFYATIGAFVTILSLKGYAFIKNFLTDLPLLYQQQIEPFINSSLSSVQSVWKGADVDVAQTIDSLIISFQDSLLSIVTSFSKSFVSMITDFAASLPNFIISLFFSIISSFFIIVDYQKIIVFLTKQLPERGKDILFTARHYFTHTLLRFIFAYAKIMTLTFLELSIGLSILGVENAMVIAFIIAIFDVLPVLGTGGIMLPWILISFLNQQPKLAVGLLIIYLVITVIRNIIEPKIVGNQIGLHPVLMLLCMYLGARLFGILGIFIMPFSILILKNLNQTKKIHLYKD